MSNMAPQSTAVPSATAEIIQLSPTTIPSGLPPSTPQKRKITPSAETSHKKRAAVVTYPGMIKPFQRSIQRSALPDPVGWPASAAYARIGKCLSVPPSKKQELTIDVVRCETSPPSKSSLSGRFSTSYFRIPFAKSTLPRICRTSNITTICKAHHSTIRSSSQARCIL